MAITPKLEIRQSQSLLMTPQLRQAINLLQMNNLELSALLEQEINANPLLERETDDIGNAAEIPQTIDDYDRPTENEYSETEFSPDMDERESFDDYGSDNEGYNNQDNNYGWEDINQRKNNYDGEDFDYFEKRLEEKPSLYDILKKQIGLTFKPRIEQIIALRLCEYLDGAGYFRGDIKQIASQLKISAPRIENILNRLKGLEPSGIFAQNLAECLKIQAQEKGYTDTKLFLMLEHLPLLGEGKFKELKKICNLNDEELNKNIKTIKSLNPKPCADYNSITAVNIIPDVFVTRDKYGIYHIELNNMSLPRVLINRHYYSEIKDKDKKSKKYLKEQLSSANFLIKSLHQRAVSILKVCEEIVKYQYDFFEKGIEYLKPMTLKDVATNIEMHESTISRISNGKYMHTPLGIFELKYFFSQAAGSYIGEENTSVLSIKHKLKKWIEEEKAEHILSDEELSELLAREGIRVARRTVAKYRESLGIGTSAQRKREKRRS